MRSFSRNLILISGLFLILFFFLPALGAQGRASLLKQTRFTGRQQPTLGQIDTLIGCPIVAVVKIHAGPGAGSAIDWLLAGTCVEIDARTVDNSWVRIVSEESQVSKPGWVPAAQLILDQPVDQLPAINLPPVASLAEQSVTPLQPAAGSVRACVIVNSLNIRRYAGAQYSIQGLLRRDDCVDVTGITADREWGKTERGWISIIYTDITGDLNKVKVWYNRYARPPLY